MSLQEDLLEQASHLATREAIEPKQASLRRSVSAAYYALFQLLTADSAVMLGPHLSLQRRALVQRWFNHAEMRRVCQAFLVSTFNKPPSLVGFSPSVELRFVASSFVRLQQARHTADYDIALPVTRVLAQEYTALAQEAFTAWAAIRNTEEANTFILALLLFKNFDIER